jgi:hypothetical protein
VLAVLSVVSQLLLLHQLDRLLIGADRQPWPTVAETAVITMLDLTSVLNPETGQVWLVVPAEVASNNALHISRILLGCMWQALPRQCPHWENSTGRVGYNSAYCAGNGHLSTDPGA